jgi:superfamily II DNA or RNA helicase
MVFLKNHNVFYSQDELNKMELTSHVQACSLKELNFMTPFPKIHKYCIKYKGLLAFPPNYALNEMGWDGRDLRVTDGARWSSDIVFRGVLQSALKQDEAFEISLNEMENSKIGGSVLCLPCGFGKTVVSLAIVAALKRKAFILVHTKFLAQQWIERINQFIPKANVYQFTSRSKQNDDRDANISIGLMQTIHKLPSYYFSNYGVLVIDEVHHLPCATLMQALPRFNSRYTLGLSATPNRSDGLSKYIEWSIGNIGYHIKPSYPRVVALISKFKTDPIIARSFTEYIKIEEKISINDKRTTHVEEIVVNIRKKENFRNILILTLRRQHAIDIFEKIRTNINIGNIELLIGGSELQFDKLNAANVIVSTYQLVSEGFDCPNLNTLIFAMPKSDIVQTVGRITRGKSGDVKPWIVDIVDVNEHDAMRRFSKRKQLYKQLKIKTVE